MGKIGINRPEDVGENIKLTTIKLPTIGVVGENKEKTVRIFMTADRQFRTLEIADALIERADRSEVESAVAEALKIALNGIEEVREAEFMGRLNRSDEFPWNVIRELIS